VSRFAVEGEDEYIAEQMANGSGHDVRAFWSGTIAAPLLPIGVKVLAHSVFHERVSTLSLAALADAIACPRLAQTYRHTGLIE
jgi:hypothetical protein